MRIIYFIFLCFCIQFLILGCSNWEHNPTAITTDTNVVTRASIPPEYWAFPNGIPVGINVFYFTSVFPVFSGTSDGKFYFATKMPNFISAGQTMERVQINCFAIANVPLPSHHAANTYFAFAGTDKGLYFSTNVGREWLKYNYLGEDSLSKISGIQMSGNFIYLFGKFNNSNRIKGYIDSNYKETSYFVPTDYNITAFSSFSSNAYYIGLKNSSKCGIFAGILGGTRIIYLEDSNVVNSFTSSLKNTFAGTKHGVYSSSNFGRSWQCIGLDTIDIKFMANDSKYVIYAASSNKVFISFDEGASFIEITPENINNSSIVFLGVKDDVVYGKTQSNVFFSLSNPSTKVSILTPSPYFPFNGSNNIGSQVSLSWFEWADLPFTYHIQISQDPAFKESTIYSVSHSPCQISNLKIGVKYYWRIRSQFGIYQSPWSEVYIFST